VALPGLHHSEQRPQRFGRVAEQRDLDRVAVGQPAAVDVDLHGPGLARRGVELRPRVVGADQQQGVAGAHELGAGGGAEMAHDAGVERQVLIEHRLAEQRRGDAGAEPLGQFHHFPGGAVRALPDQDRPPLPRAQHLGRGPDVHVVGHHPCRAQPRARHQHAVRVLGRVRCRRRLDVVRQHHAGRAARGERGTERPVHQHRNLLGGVRRLYELGTHVAEQPDQVDLLLVGAAEHRRHLLPDDRHHRLRVELGVVQAVEQVHGARPLGGQAHPDTAGVLGVPDRHERGRLLVPGLDERRLAGPAQRTDDAVDAVARVAEHPVDTPLQETFDEHVRGVSIRHPPHLPAPGETMHARSGAGT
jgi:hypothetical protein